MQKENTTFTNDFHKPINIAIIGATGNVGRIITDLILTREIVSAQQIKLFASEASAGKTLTSCNHDFTVQAVENWDFSDSLICVFATDSDISKRYIPIALSKEAFVVDSSSLYRLNPEVPLIVAPINKSLVSISKSRLYAIANCIASPISVVLAPLHQALSIKRVNVVTFQSTSGAGKGPMDELYAETKSIFEDKPYQRQYFSRQIAFNIIPQIDNIMEDGFTYEEFKIIHEIKKIVASDLAITATAVRVPVMVGHSISLTIEFQNDFNLKEIQNLLNNSPSIKISSNNFTTPAEVVDSDEVHIGRIRRDPSVPYGLQLWLCSDNLRRGAATDAVEVVEELVNQFQKIK